jgi:hypothetical protein
MLQNFKGLQYRQANNWFPLINVHEFKDKPIKYLEVGTFHGSNIISVGLTYCLHPNSEMYCIDPWEDYDEYPEYKNQQQSNYNLCMENINNSGMKDKIKVIKGYSNIEVPKLEDNYFDIIYIDGNHEPEFVLEDGVLSFRKLKVGGYLIFDDYGWGGPDLTKRGIDGFVNGYKKRIELIGMRDSQVVMRKLR